MVYNPYNYHKARRRAKWGTLIGYTLALAITLAIMAIIAAWLKYSVD